VLQLVFFLVGRRREPPGDFPVPTDDNLPRRHGSAPAARAAIGESWRANRVLWQACAVFFKEGGGSHPCRALSWQIDQ